MLQHERVLHNPGRKFFTDESLQNRVLVNVIDGRKEHEIFACRKVHGLFQPPCPLSAVKPMEPLVPWPHTLYRQKREKRTGPPKGLTFLPVKVDPVVRFFAQQCVYFSLNFSALLTCHPLLPVFH